MKSPLSEAARVRAGVTRRAREARARRLLAPMAVGRWPLVEGRPIIRATDATVGDSFQMLSAESATTIQGTGKLRIGSGVIINSGAWIDCWLEMTLEDHAIIGQGSLIADSDMHGVAGEAKRMRPVVIGEGAWVGARVIIIPGVTVGSRSVVGAGSVVTKDVPPDTVVAGNPATVRRTLTFPPGQRKAYTA